MFKKIEVSRLDVCVAYLCGAFLLYVVGGVAYRFGKIMGKSEVADRVHEIYANGGSIEIHEGES